MNRIDLVDENLLKQEEAQLYDAGAERGFLACLMAKPELILDAEQQVHPNMLFIDLHRYCYQVMLFVAKSCARNNWMLSFDNTTVLSVAQQMGEAHTRAFVQKTEGMDRWREIKDFAAFVSMESFPRYQATVRDRAARVKMFREARRLQKAVRELDVHPEAANVAGQYEAMFSRVAFGASGDDESRLRRLGEYIDPLMAKIDLSHANPDAGVFHLHHPDFPFWMELMGGGFRRNVVSQ